MPPDVSTLADPVRRRLYRALARRAFLGEGGGSMVDWAVEALAAGWDSAPLRVLAGLVKPPNEFEVGRVLTETLKSLGLEMPEMDELVRAAAFVVAGDIVSGATLPRVGCAELSRLCSATGYRESLMPFYTAEEAYALAETGVYGTVEEVTEAVLDDARRLVESSTLR
ncbi:MAG TPA: hypothetical protein VEP68_03720 [Anaeromyxobacteraceae bacterium]|nr:hypothetical protein [Anaeromyxobacteraceae bacterium]